MTDGRAARQWLGTKEAAAYLGVSERFLYRHKSTCPPTHVVAGRFRYSVDALEKWLADRQWKKLICS
jgi:hypothetical protein